MRRLFVTCRNFPYHFDIFQCEEVRGGAMPGQADDPTWPITSQCDSLLFPGPRPPLAVVHEPLNAHLPLPGHPGSTHLDMGLLVEKNRRSHASLPLSPMLAVLCVICRHGTHVCQVTCIFIPAVASNGWDGGARLFFESLLMAFLISCICVYRAGRSRISMPSPKCLYSGSPRQPGTFD